jgi:hypothetical protein
VAHLRKGETYADLACGFGIGTSTVYRLWVPETLHMSCDVLIFVEEAAEAVVSSDVVDRGSGAGGEWP